MNTLIFLAAWLAMGLAGVALGAIARRRIGLPQNDRLTQVTASFAGPMVLIGGIVMLIYSRNILRSTTAWYHSSADAGRTTRNLPCRKTPPPDSREGSAEPTLPPKSTVSPEK